MPLNDAVGHDITELAESDCFSIESGYRKQTLENVLIDGEEPTDEFLAEFIALNEAPPVSDEDLESQALNHPGEDGDPATPE